MAPNTLMKGIDNSKLRPITTIAAVAAATTLAWIRSEATFWRRMLRRATGWVATSARVDSSFCPAMHEAPYPMVTINTMRGAKLA